MSKVKSEKKNKLIPLAWDKSRSSYYPNRLLYAVRVLFVAQHRHTYIIGHYNSLIRIMPFFLTLLTPIMLCVLILFMNDGTAFWKTFHSKFIQFLPDIC